jgi:hypothetical protein
LPERSRDAHLDRVVGEAFIESPQQRNNYGGLSLTLMVVRIFTYFTHVELSSMVDRLM